MPLAGKYNFPGIKKAGVAAIEAALATTTWGASLMANVFFKLFKPAEEALLGLAIEWFANKGLIVLNLGAIYVNGEIDQGLFDRAMDEGLKKVENGRDKLSEADGRKIDNDVILAARRFIDFGAAPNELRTDDNSGLQSGSNSSL